MEVLVLLLAGGGAVLHALAFTDGAKNPTHTAELTVTNLNALLIFILVCETRHGHLHDYDLITELEFTNCELAADIGLERLTREGDPRVLLLLAFLLRTGSSHVMVALSQLFEALKEIVLVLCHPEANIRSRDGRTLECRNSLVSQSRSDHISDALFCVRKTLLLRHLNV